MMQLPMLIRQLSVEPTPAQGEVTLTSQPPLPEDLIIQ